MFHNWGFYGNFLIDQLSYVVYFNRPIQHFTESINHKEINSETLNRKFTNF